MDRLTRLATRVLRAQTAIIWLINAGQKSPVSAFGLPSSLESSGLAPALSPLYEHVAGNIAPTVIGDTRMDPRGICTPFLTAMGPGAVLGAPLVPTVGRSLGALCVIDNKPRDWTPDEIQMLTELAAVAVDELELRSENRRSIDPEVREETDSLELRGMIDTLIAFVGLMTPDGVLLTANKSALDAAGLTIDDVMNKPFEDTYWWSYDPRIQQQLRASIQRAAEGESVRYDVDVRVRNGQLITIDFMLAPMRDETGQITHLIPSAIDITDRKRTENERARLLQTSLEAQRQAESVTRTLEIERNRLRQVLDVIPEGILIAEPDRHLSMCNSAGAEILGADLTGERSRSVAIDAFQPRLPGGTALSSADIPIARSLLRGETVRGERIVIRRADSGEDVPILTSTAPLLSDDRTIVGAVAVFQDISAIIHEEQQKDDFIATLSHDLRSPITAIRGHAQILQRLTRRMEDPLVPRLNDGLERIDAATRHMVQILDDLVDLAYLAIRRDVAMRREQTDLSAIVRDAIADYRERSEDHAIRLESEDEVVGQLDGPRLRRVVENLLSNAVKYSPGGGNILVQLNPETRNGQPWCNLTVSDQGVGIPEEDLPRLFDRYRRGTNVGGIKGTGLGLAGAQQIVQQHGGEITIDSVVNRGTTVTIRLPLEPPAE